MSEIEDGLCRCGCQGKTKISEVNRPERGLVKGKPLRFIKGHSRRGTGLIPAQSELRIGGKDNRRGVMLLCAHCGKGFVTRPRTTRPLPNWCSRSCALLGDQERCQRLCALASKTAAARGDAQRGGGEGKTYTKFMGQHEHRVVAERKIGRPLAKGEVVHHVDGNFKNNDPENLEVLPSQAEHARIHSKAYWAKRKAAQHAG